MLKDNVIDLELYKLDKEAKALLKYSISQYKLTLEIHYYGIHMCAKAYRLAKLFFILSMTLYAVFVNAQISIFTDDKTA